MAFKDQIMKEVFETYFKNVLSDLLPNAISEAINSSTLLKRQVKRQEFISLSRAIRRYNLSRKTFYNYHQRGYITLHSSEGKTFVSVTDLESHIKSNPLPRKL